MTTQEANKLKLVNAICNITAESVATLKIAHLKRMIKAYETGMITAQEFLNA